MPRGSGHPDLSQRPRREAPGLLTGLAILERELGLVEYARHQLAAKLAGRHSATVTRRLRAELAELEGRRLQTLRLLDELHQEYKERAARDGGASLRDR